MRARPLSLTTSVFPSSFSQTSRALTALVLAASTAPATANIWGDLTELDRKKAAIDARIKDSLAEFKNVTKSGLAAGMGGFEEKVKIDKEAIAEGLAIKLANLTAAKEALGEGKKNLKEEADKKWWAAFNKTGEMEWSAKKALGALGNKTATVAEVAAAKVEELKEGAAKTSEANKEALEKGVGALGKKTGDKAAAIAEKVANATAVVEAKVEAVSMVKEAKLNATFAASVEKMAALDAWKDGLANKTAEKLVAMDGKLNATLAAKEERDQEKEKALETKAEALATELAALEMAKDGVQAKLAKDDAEHSVADGEKVAEMAAKIEAVEAELDAKLAAKAAMNEVRERLRWTERKKDGKGRRERTSERAWGRSRLRTRGRGGHAQRETAQREPPTPLHVPHSLSLSSLTQAKANATKLASDAKWVALGAVKERLGNLTEAKVEGLAAKLNATAAMKEEAQAKDAARLGAKVEAIEGAVAKVDAAKDGLELSKSEREKAVAEKVASKAAGTPHHTDLGAATSALKLPTLRKGIPGVDNAFFAAPAEQAAGDADTAAPGAMASVAAPADASAVPTSGAGVSSAVGSAGPPAATAAFQVELPKSTTADWTPAKQTSFAAAVAEWARVPAEAVTIQGVSSDGGVIDTAIDFADEASAAGFARKLASDGAGLAAATTAAGLGAAKPTEVQVAGADATSGGQAGARGGAASKPTGLSAGAIAGITVGSAAGAVILAAAVGAGVAANNRKKAGAGV